MRDEVNTWSCYLKYSSDISELVVSDISDSLQLTSGLEDRDDLLFGKQRIVLGRPQVSICIDEQMLDANADVYKWSVNIVTPATFDLRKRSHCLISPYTVMRRAAYFINPSDSKYVDALSRSVWVTDMSVKTPVKKLWMHGKLIDAPGATANMIWELNDPKSQKDICRILSLLPFTGCGHGTRWGYGGIKTTPLKRR